MLNRDQLFASLRHHISEASGRLGLLIFRAQRLREFNLQFGYEAAELSASTIESRLRGAVRANDEVLRIGDCDFAVILPGLRNREHVSLAATKLVRVLRLRPGTDEQRPQVSVALGGAICPDDSNDADQLCRCADSACDPAAHSPEGFALYHPGKTAPNLTRNDLRRAIAASQLDLYLQPIIDLRGASGERFEALARWTHSEPGKIPPDVFVRFAEQNELINDLTRWSINTALRYIAIARESGRSPGISINLSALVLRQPGLPEQIVDLARFWNVPCETIILELTETSLMDDPGYCTRVLGQLRDRNFEIAIDDFGTGYSSMAYLKQLPAAELKIDKSFVIGMRDDARSERPVRSMLDLGHECGLKVVAEGVEDAETLAKLRALGCDYAQGYHLGTPEPAADALTMQYPDQAST